MKHWADGGETSLRNLLLLCRRHHRAVHEGRVKVGTNRDGTALFFTRTGRILVDVPEMSRPMRNSNRDASRSPVPPEGLRPLAAEDPTLAHPGDSNPPPAPPMDPGLLSNGAALYSDSAIPWAIEAVAREAVEGSLQGTASEIGRKQVEAACNPLPGGA